ncbi:MAG TPA: glycosyltransferase family 1 protein, partial [Candidatus Dormibacteraeota bacterium]|nr:glycosyltransferase family 1 protein [Candidatus Dormibacteraeota bacterium]
LMGRSLRGRYSGVVRYTEELVRALAAQIGPDLTVFLTRADDGLDGISARRVRAPLPTPNEYLRAFWEQTLVPFEIARLRPDVYHSPNYILPLAIGCPTVVTVHDLGFFEPAVHRLRSRLYLRALTGMAIERARRVICVSNYTRQCLVRRFPGTEDRIRVVGEGVGSRFRPQPPEAVAAFRARHHIDRPYALFVGTIEPRKNLPRLIKAFGKAVVEGGIDHDLVIAGGRGWMGEGTESAYALSRCQDRIRFIGYVPDDELPAAYSGADLFVYPSLFEGYGLPPVEAMACATAVLTSRTGALPEVVGGAATLIDPTDEAAITGALLRLLTSESERRRLEHLGLERAASFRWDRVAEQTMAVYREAAA